MAELPRLSNIEAEILELLVLHGEMYGLEMVQASARLKRGTVYVTLGRMADKGLVSSRAVKPRNEGGMPRRLFSVTGFGSRAIAAIGAARAVFAGA